MVKVKIVGYTLQYITGEIDRKMPKRKETDSKKGIERNIKMNKEKERLYRKKEIWKRKIDTELKKYK